MSGCPCGAILMGPHGPYICGMDGFGSYGVTAIAIKF